MADVAPNASKIQIEAVRFRSAISEALAQQIAGNINYLLSFFLPIGSILHSTLTEAQFQALTSAGWILADGRDITGSALATLTGVTTAPDARGVFLRGKNNGRSAATGNAAGEVAMGTYTADQNKSHTHGVKTGGAPFGAIEVMYDTGI